MLILSPNATNSLELCSRGARPWVCESVYVRVWYPKYRSRSCRRMGSADDLKHQWLSRVPWSTPGHLHSLFNVEVVFISYLQLLHRPVRHWRSFQGQSVHWRAASSHSQEVRLSGPRTMIVRLRSLQEETGTPGTARWWMKLLLDCSLPSRSECLLHCWQRPRWTGSGCCWTLSPSRVGPSASAGPGAALIHWTPVAHLRYHHLGSLPPDSGKGWTSHNWIPHHCLSAPVHAACGQYRSLCPDWSHPLRTVSRPVLGRSWVAWGQK